MAIRGRSLARDLPSALSKINLVRQHDEWERLWIARRRLDQEFVAPTVDVLERCGIVDIIHQDAAVSAAIKSYAEGLETFLAGRVPNLLVPH
jgi:hypothetical protein